MIGRIIQRRTYIIGKPLKTHGEIESLFSSTPEYSAVDLISDTKKGEEEDKIDNVLLNRVLKNSGLSMDLSSSSRKELINALKSQVSFIRKLHSTQLTDREIAETNGEHKLSYNELIEQVGEVKPSEILKEVGQWNISELSKVTADNYLIVKEGLGKSD